MSNLRKRHIHTIQDLSKLTSMLHCTLPRSCIKIRKIKWYKRRKNQLVIINQYSVQIPFSSNVVFIKSHCYEKNDHPVVCVDKWTINNTHRCDSKRPQVFTSPHLQINKLLFQSMGLRHPRRNDNHHHNNGLSSSVPNNNTDVFSQYWQTQWRGPSILLLFFLVLFMSTTNTPFHFPTLRFNTRGMQTLNYYNGISFRIKSE